MLKSIPRWTIRAILIVLATYGMLFFSYKFHIPWSGANDFAHYYPMYVEPLDFSVAPAPFVFRQLSALLTHTVYKLGIYYPNEIQFKEPNLDQRIFFAAIFINYLSLTVTAWLTGTAVNSLIRTRSLIYPLISGFFCFFSFFTPVYILTGLTEGLSWLMMTAGFIAYIHHRLFLLSAILLLAVLQRETIIITFGVISACGLLINRNEKWQTDLKILCWSLVCFFLLACLRKFSGVEGQSGQLDPIVLLAHLQRFRFTREILLQGILSQNLLAIYCLLGLMAIRQMPEQKFWMPALLTTFMFLFVIGIAAGIGNNVGRICGILTPIFAIFSGKALWHLEGAREGNNHYRA